MSRNHRLNKLTKEQQKALYAPTEENTGAGWNAKGEYDNRPPRYVNRERDTTKPIDKEFV